MRTGSKHKRIGIFVDTDHSVRRDAVRGFIRYATNHFQWQFALHWPLLIDWSLRPGLKLDAVVAWPFAERHLAFLKKLPVPVLCLGSDETPGFPRVGFDNIAAGRLGARYLLGRGFRDFGMLIGENGMEHLWERERLEGFKKTSELHGGHCRVFSRRMFSSVPSRHARLKKEIEEWVNGNGAPKGLLADTDASGFNLLRMVQEMDINVPERLSVLSVGGDDMFCASASPPMSSVILPGEKLGHEAARQLERILARKGGASSQVTLIEPVELRERESSTMLAFADEAVSRAMRFLHQHAHDPITLADVLKDVPLSRRALEIRFKKAVGRTLQKELWRIRLDRARHLLAETSLSMPDIAMQGGFADAQRFSEVFRRELKLSPTAYRKKHQDRLSRG